MKLADIKGNIAVKVNEILYTKFEEYLNEFILELPEKYKSTIKQEHSNPGRKLFNYNKEIKDFLSTGHGYFDKSWYNSYEDNNKLEEDAKVLGLVQGKGPIEYFKFENKYFSGNISISSSAHSKAWGGYSSKSIYHRANVYLKIKDIDALMKELDQALGNKTSLGYKKLKDARGVEIKVGDIIVCSDSHYAGVWLAEVLSLSDVMIGVSGAWGKINKYPGDVIVVSREAITKK